MKDLFYLLCAFLCFSFNAYSQCTVPRHINGPPGSVCASSEITVMSLLGQSNYQWDVSPGGVITSVGGSFFPTAKVMWTTPGAHWVSVNFTDMNGCIASSPGVFNVQVVAAPAAPAITGDFEVCQNTPAGSTGNVYTTAPGKASYQWSVTGGSITSGTGTNTVTVTWAASYPSSRTIAVRYAEAGNACLSATATEEVTILTTGTPALSGNTIACAGTSHIYATDPDKSNYVWTVDGGTITSGGTSSSNTVTILWEGDFFNTVSVRYTESNGCATQTNTVGVLTQPSPTVGGNTAVCLNSAGNVYTTEPGRSNYAWNVTGGVITAGGAPADATATITWTSPGNQSVSVGYSGCETPTVRTITVHPTTPIISGSATSTLSCTSIYATQAGMQNYQWAISGGGTLQAYNHQASVTWNSTGPKTISVSYSGPGCTGTTTTKDVMVSAPTVPTLSGNMSPCDLSLNYTYTTESGRTNYQWTLGGCVKISGGTSTDNTVTVKFDSPYPYIGIAYTDPNGCYSPSKSFSITLPPAPQLNWISSVCEGKSLTFTTDAGMSNYIWSVSAGGTITAGGTAANNTTTVTWNSPGPQSISVGYTNTDGCPRPPTVREFTVNPLPVPTISGSASVCLGSSNTYTTEAGMSEYSWSAPQGTIVSGGGYGDNSITVQWISTGPRTILLGYRNTNACTSATRTVKNIDVVQPSVTGDLAVCKGETITYTTAANKTNYTWTLSAGATIIAGGTPADNSVSVLWDGPPGTETISVAYTDETGCNSSSSPASVYVRALPVATMEGASFGCLGSAAAYTTQPEYSGYVWSVPADGIISGGGTTSSNNISIAWSSEGSRTISVRFTDAYGCTALPVAKTITVVQPAPATLTGVSSQCFSAAALLYSTEPGMTVYRYTASPGGTLWAVDAAGNRRFEVSNGSYFSGTNVSPDKISVSWNSPGDKTLSVSYINPATGCISTGVRNITLHALPAPLITATATAACSGSNITYTTTEGMSDYEWINGGGTVVAAAGNSMTLTLTPWYSSINTVTVGYTDGNGCRGYGHASTTVWPQPTPEVTPQFTTLCAGSTGNVYTTEAGMQDYTWTIPAAATVTSGGTLADNTVIIDWKPDTKVSQQVSVLYTEPVHGCRATWSVPASIQVKPLPAPTLWKNTGCLSDNNQYSTEGGMQNYVWSISPGGTIMSGGTSSSPSATIRWNSTGPQFVSVNYTTPAGCQTSTPRVNNFTVNNLPVPSLAGPSAVPMVHTNPAYTDAAIYTTESGMTDYIWWFDGVPDFNFTSSASHVWNTIGSKSVQVTYADASGCEPLMRGSKGVTVAFNQTVTFNMGSYGPYTYGVAPFNVFASASSGLPVTFSSSDPSVATVSGNVVTVAGAGTFTLTATQAGGTGYFPATASKTITINKANQVITFGALPAKSYGDAPFTPTASGGASGNPVTFTSSNSAVATASGNTVTITGGGTTTITASQAGNANYNAATPIAQTLIVQGVPVVSITSPSSGVYWDYVNLTTNTGGSTGAVTYSVVNGTGSATVSGSTLWLTGAGTITIHATVAADANYLAATASQNFTITRAGQVITFNTIDAKTVGDVFNLSATASSDLPLTFTITNTSVGTLTGSTVTAVGLGSATITASQAGDANYFAATNISRSLIVNPFTVQITGDRIYCPGGSADLRPTGENISGASYVWSNGVTNFYNSVSAPGTYSLTVTKATGVSATSNTIQVTAAEVTNGGTITSNVAANCFSYGGQVITLTASPPGTQYTWSTGATAPSVDITSPGNYAVTITSSAIVRKGCVKIHACYLRTHTPGEGEESAEPEIQSENAGAGFDFYPNPADGEMKVELNEAALQHTPLQLFDQFGKVVRQDAFEKGESVKTVDIHNLAGGVYIIQIESKRRILRSKVMVLHEN